MFTLSEHEEKHKNKKRNIDRWSKRDAKCHDVSLLHLISLSYF